MSRQTLSIPAVANSLWAAHFALTDGLRRTQGDALDALGLGPRECEFQVICWGPHWRLRAYGGFDAGPLLLMVPAPIKRPYIWDLTPSISAVRYCLHQGFRVHLLEWIPPDTDGSAGLDGYSARAIAACAATISKQANGTRPFLMGHSLGGTLAAIYCALEPRSVKGLVLLGAPLCFEEASSRALDEVALPGKLVNQIFHWLYREDRFCHGTLTVLDKTVGPPSIAIPMLAIVNVADEIAPLTSVTPFVNKMLAKDIRIIEHPDEIGVGMPHLGTLVGRAAYAQVWPQIVAWLKARS